MFCCAIALHVTLSVLTVCHCGVCFLLRIIIAHYISTLTFCHCGCEFVFLLLRIVIAHCMTYCHCGCTILVMGIGMIEIIVIGTHCRDCRLWSISIISFMNVCMAICPITLLCRNSIVHEFVFYRNSILHEFVLLFGIEFSLCTDVGTIQILILHV